MQIITFISLSDLIGNIPYTMSYRPSDGNWWCSLEGFLNLYCYPVSWMWTTMMMYFLYSLASSGKLPLSKFFIHLLCWGLPLLFTLLNLTTNRFGSNYATGENSEYEVCTLSGNDFTAEMWHFTTYYGLWMFCVVVMGVLYWRIRVVQSDEQRAKFPAFQMSMVALKLYPVAMVVCWLPHVVAVYFTYLFPDIPDLYQIYFVADSLKITHGFVTAVIFFYKSAEARVRWTKLISKLGRKLFLLPPAAPQRTESKDVTEAAPGGVDSEVDDFSVEYDEPPRGETSPNIAIVDVVSNLLWTGHSSPKVGSPIGHSFRNSERQSSIEIC